MPRWHVVSWIVMGKRQLENEQPLAEADEAAGQSTQKQRLTSNAPSVSDASPAELADRLSLGEEMQRCHSLGGTYTEPPEPVDTTLQFLADLAEPDKWPEEWRLAVEQKPGTATETLRRGERRSFEEDEVMDVITLQSELEFQKQKNKKLEAEKAALLKQLAKLGSQRSAASSST